MIKKTLIALLLLIPSLSWGDTTDENWSYQSVGIGSSFIELSSNTTYANKNSHSGEFKNNSYTFELGKQIQFNSDIVLGIMYSHHFSNYTNNNDCPKSFDKNCYIEVKRKDDLAFKVGYVTSNIFLPYLKLGISQMNYKIGENQISNTSNFFTDTKKMNGTFYSIGLEHKLEKFKNILIDVGVSKYDFDKTSKHQLNQTMTTNPNSVESYILVKYIF
tara:strand:+ start:95 stop:745 length:651 start_codon:yes stop_codon:yes gene_type:complete